MINYSMKDTDLKVNWKWYLQTITSYYSCS